MIYKEDFIYIIYWVTHVTDGVTVDIIWIQRKRMPWFNTSLGHLKKEKVFIFYLFYISFILYIYSIYLIY